MGLQPQQNISLASFTSWLVGGVSEYFSQPETVEQCQQAINWAVDNSQSITVLGGGSNVLVSDDGVKGLTICLRKLAGLQVSKENGRVVMLAMSGTAKSEILKACLKHQIAPALFLAGLPGDVGGGVAMNAGVSENMVPREFVEIVDWIEVLPLSKNSQVQKISARDLKWSYRHCDGWQPGIIVRVQLSWPDEPNPEILKQVRAANQVRLQKQPLNFPSCGSVFVNPPGHKAGKLIDECGLRGFRIGDAQVSEKHANFIVNLGQAKAREIHSVIQHVQKQVLAQKGVQLVTEVRYMGDW